MYIKAYSAELKRKMRLSYRSEEEGSTYAVGVGNIKAKAQLNPKLNIPSTIQTQWTLYPFDQFDRLGRQGSISVKYPTYEGCYIFMEDFFYLSFGVHKKIDKHKNERKTANYAVYYKVPSINLRY